MTGSQTVAPDENHSSDRPVGSLLLSNGAGVSDAESPS
jgi:hypothetical protein